MNPSYDPRGPRSIGPEPTGHPCERQRRPDRHSIAPTGPARRHDRSAAHRDQRADASESRSLVRPQREPAGSSVGRLLAWPERARRLSPMTPPGRAFDRADLRGHLLPGGLDGGCSARVVPRLAFRLRNRLLAPNTGPVSVGWLRGRRGGHCRAGAGRTTRALLATAGGGEREHEARRRCPPRRLPREGHRPSGRVLRLDLRCQQDTRHDRGGRTTRLSRARADNGAPPGPDSRRRAVASRTGDDVSETLEQAH